MDRRDHSMLMSELATELANAQGEDKTAQTAILRVITIIPDADLASLTIRTTHGQWQTIAASSTQASDLDQLQHDLQEGPCVEAAAEDDWLRSGDLARDERWPRWGPRAADEGVGSLLCLPLNTAHSRSGALSLYSHARGRFADREEVDFALTFAAHAAIALASAHTTDGLTTALVSRHSIGLAQGILVERYGLTVDQSFDLLRRCSSTTNTKLSALAQQIIETGRLPE